METWINVLKKPKLKSPILIEGLPGIGLVGKIAVDYMAEELKAVKIAEIYSNHLPPQVIIDEKGVASLSTNELWYVKHPHGKEDMVILLGDSQGLTPDGQYQISSTVLEFAEKNLKIKKIYTLGGLGTGTIPVKPMVFAAVSDEKLKKALKKYGVSFRENGAIFGAAGLLIGLGKLRGIPSICLMGETHGQMVDARSAKMVLEVLTKILGIEIDMTRLEKRVKEIEKEFKRIEEMIAQQKMAEKKEKEIMHQIPTYIR